MGNNSVRPNITKDDIVAEIQLTIDADFQKKGVFIIVEGIDDIAFFKGKLTDSVTLYESFSGKLGVYEIVNHFSNNRVIGICDRDYEEIEDNHIFYYDFNCLEIMLISNDSVFKSITNVHYNGNMDFRTLRSSIFIDLKVISLTRKVNSSNSWGLVLNGISFFRTFINNTKHFDSERLTNELVRLNPHLLNTKSDKLQIIREFQSVHCSEEDYYFLTQGHDFLFCLQVHCSYEKAKKARCFNADIIFACLLSAFNIQEFKKTKLFSKLSNYEATYSLEIIA